MPSSVSLDIYDRYARIYDATFGRVLGHRLACAIQKLHLRPGDRVLDIGVGTGLTLDHYPAGVTVVGVDRSRGMLAKAERRARSRGLLSVELHLADAQRLELPDDSFDAVFMGHVLSVVDDPKVTLREALRVARPGATFAIVNHFQLEHPIGRPLEQLFAPVFKHLGWRSDLRFQLLQELEGFEVLERTRLNPRDLWDIVLLRSTKQAAAQQSAANVAHR